MNIPLIIQEVNETGDAVIVMLKYAAFCLHRAERIKVNSEMLNYS